MFIVLMTTRYSVWQILARSAHVEARLELCRPQQGDVAIDVPGRPGAEIRIRSIAVPLVRFDGKIVAALNIGVQPEQVSAKAMIADYVPLLVREALALRERLVEPNQKPF
jgi:hypothetical protein